MCQQEKKTMQSEVMYIFWKNLRIPRFLDNLSAFLRHPVASRPQWYWSPSCLRSASRDALTPGGWFFPLKGGRSPRKWCPNFGRWHAQRFFSMQTWEGFLLSLMPEREWRLCMCFGIRNRMTSLVSCDCIMFFFDTPLPHLFRLSMLHWLFV